MDSGATDTVGPPSIAPQVKVRETARSRAGYKYRSAKGEEISNY